MEFLGKTVKKEFKKRGIYSGTVKSYDASSGCFAIAYEDGDTEELDLSEVASLLEEEAEKEKERGGGEAAAEERPRLGRKPKRRRRVEPMRKPCENFGAERPGNDYGNGYLRNVDLNNGIGLVRGLKEIKSGINVDLNEIGESGNGFVDNLKEGIDLNEGFNLNLNEEVFDLNEEGYVDVNVHADCQDDFKKEKRECIDLNLDVNCEVDDNCTVDLPKKECRFDLNMGIEDEEFKDDGEEDCGGKMNESLSVEKVNEGLRKMEEGKEVGGVVKRIHDGGDIENGTLVEVYVSIDSCLAAVQGIQNKDIVYGEDFKGCNFVEVLDANGLREDPPEVIDLNQGDVRFAYKEGSGRRRRGRRKHVDNMCSMTETPVCKDSNGVKEDCTVVIDVNQGDMESAYRESSRRWRRGRKPSNNLNSMSEIMVFMDDNAVKEEGNMEVGGNVGDLGSAYQEVCGSCRKRRKVLDNVNNTPLTTVLRRSTRRGSAKSDALGTIMSNMVNDTLSPAVSALTEEKPVISHYEIPEEPAVLPPKVKLPPSSQNLDLGEISVLDVFSIYACLRSFSALLFLSPFELEEFVAALKCSCPSSLFDYIHVSILQILRKHLEYLANEGSESASNCLRSLNWDLLDLITWPVLMAEYLLLHGSGFKPGFDLSCLKLFNSDYCKQPVSVKVEVLRCLCDDMIEVEAIRSELSRRSSGGDTDLDFDRNVNLGASRKRKSVTDFSGGSFLTEEDAADETADWNSDECCLCKMDGSLICCDGCPAAFHSKCVGVANESLPEGDWYCPECAIDRQKPWMKPRKSLRGADLLGVDPFGRLYFSSCGYLLVADSCDTESSFNYYHRDDLSVVIEMLQSSEMYYGVILEAIRKHWDIPVSLCGARKHTICLDVCKPPDVLASSETHMVNNEVIDVQKHEEKFVTGRSSDMDIEVPKSVNPTYMSSEGSAEVTQTNSENQNFRKEGLDSSNRSADILNGSAMPRGFPTMGDNSLTTTSLGIKQQDCTRVAATGHASAAANKINSNASPLQPGTGYMNSYSFGQIASAVGEELIRKSSEKTIEDSIKSEEELISAQMKVILKNSSKFFWPNIPSLNVDVQKEKCGWCLSCRAFINDSDCLVNKILGPVQEGSATDMFGLQLKRNGKSHLTDVSCHIIFIEKRLQGLLLGPWLNPHYSCLWCKSIVKASDIRTVKRLLLKLESNLHHRALSAEWLKHMDSAVTMGSASHIVTASARASSKNGIVRKRARCSEPESNAPLSSARGLGLFWWRGGRLSRRLFSWKVLPSSLASKAARQAGCTKIKGLLYPENSDFAKRSKHVAWRAAVESSTTAEQLAFQVRELDSNIRWDEIENTYHLPMLDKELRKSIRLFKKAIIRRKAVEGQGTKYLLDFGKRRVIPEVVLKNGDVVEESKSERKKYWLNESFVPLHLLKSFEEKRIARKSSKVASGKLSEPGEAVKKPSKKRGFDYLFAKVERSGYHQCGHCNRDVPIRDAACCQYCKGYFHKRHIRKSTGSITANCTYACHQCQDGKIAKANMKKGKNDTKSGKHIAKGMKVKQQNSRKASVSCKSVQLKNNKRALRNSLPLRAKKKRKVVVVVPLRRSARRAKYNAVQKKKVGRPKKAKPVISKKGNPKKPKKVYWHKKRTQTCHSSFWLNGLLLSRKPDDERVMDFKREKFLAPFESAILDQPKCHLCCEAGYTSTSNYISCEMCGDWFHGDAFGLDAENITKLIGFRCHVCLQRDPPLCPHAPVAKSHGTQVAQVQNDVGTEFGEEETNAVSHLNEKTVMQESLLNRDNQDSLSVDGCVQRGVQLGAALHSNQSFDSESMLEVENGLSR